MQLRTHRVGVSFDVSSLRYCSQHIIDVSAGKRQVEEVFYLRPVGFYTDRNGAKYELAQHEYNERLEVISELCADYSSAVSYGQSEEHARELLPMSIRQNFVLSLNARSLLHILDLRLPKDAQSEIRDLSTLMFEQFAEWMPQVADWYQKNRLGKNKLAP